jgi:predicted phosphodiesterase
MSKTLIFSDSHLTPRFNEDYFNKLVNVIEQVDKVIINGDFWEGYFYKFDEFLSSPWSQLFPLLKKKNTVYIHGNHDLEKYIDDRASRFADLVTESHEFSSGGKNFVCIHGHQYIESPAKRSALMRMKFLLGGLYIVYYLGMLIQKEKFWKIFQFENNRLKKAQKRNFPGKILITGHTHLSEETENFINTGVMSFGFFEYAIIEDGEIRQYKERYSAPVQERFTGVFRLKK